jgi:hypothetical protein
MPSSRVTQLQRAAPILLGTSEPEVVHLDPHDPALTAQTKLRKNRFVAPYDLEDGGHTFVPCPWRRRSARMGR